MSSAAKSSVSINENIFFFSPAPLIMQSVMLKKAAVKSILPTSQINP